VAPPGDFFRDWSGRSKKIKSESSSSSRVSAGRAHFTSRGKD
jgi:hypothetical protein